MAQATREAKIALHLGVTPAGLQYLAKRLAGRNGMRGSEAAKLRDQGHLDRRDNLTDTGRAIVERARQMGW
jgi:hypothetical protein